MIKKEFFGEDKKTRMKEYARDRLYHFFLADGDVRGVLVHGSRMIREMKLNHDLGVLETIILGQAYLGTALMAAGLKNEGMVQLKIECGGPVEGLSVEGDSHGTVRGFLAQNPIPLDKAPESLDTSEFFGPGFLSVTRYTVKHGKPFTSQVMMRTGHLAEDLAAYYQESEQIQTVFILSVRLDREGEVTGAAGLFLQAMPGSEEAVLDRIQSAAQALPSMGDSFNAEADAEAYLKESFGDFNPQLLSSKRVEFLCSCNRGRFEDFLRNISAEEKKKILKKGPFPLVTTCFNCNSSYEFDKETLIELFQN